MSTQPHTEFRQGQRVIVFLRDGGVLIGKYKGKSSTSVFVDNRKFATSKIRQISIYKERK